MSEEMIKMDKDEFAEKSTPKKIDVDDPKLLFFKCACGGRHFRHAGYMEMLMPFLRGDGSKNIQLDSYEVKVCTACRKSYIWLNEQLYEVTDLIDLEAWGKMEVEMQKATGPGGQC